MKEKLLADFFASEKIEYYGSLELSECSVLYPRKLPEFTVSVCFFLIPYNVRDNGKRNISKYAVPRDYHLYVKQLEERLVGYLAKAGEDFSVKVFADNSPFSERSCAEKAGLGVRGKNGLIINKKYGSLVFIGCICLPFKVSITHIEEKFNCDLCVNCEKCRDFCPFVSGKSTECLSKLSQKKNISRDEAEILSKYPVRWGCDICQDVCPYNKDASETPIEFFKMDRIPYLTSELLCEMSENEFSQRAYSWRGRTVIERNLDL